MCEKLLTKIGKTMIAAPAQRKRASCIAPTSSWIDLPTIKFPDQKSTQSTNRKKTGMKDPLE
jgi:hypothetical protein